MAYNTMSNYYCECCHYNAKQRSNYLKHLKTKKHHNLAQISINIAQDSINIAQDSINIAQDITNIAQENTNIAQENTNIAQENINNSHCKTTITDDIKLNNYVLDTIQVGKSCPYCDKIFKHQSSLSRHMKKYCTINKGEQYQQLADLLNEKEDIIERNQIEIHETKNHVQRLEKQIEKLLSKLKITNISGSGSYIDGDQTNNTLNFQLLNYNKTDYDFLSDKDYIRCIQQNNHCVKALIEKVHFNNQRPENMNIYISSIKGKFVMVYRDNKWQVKNRKAQIDDIYDTNELMLENWYDEYHEKYPHIIKSFKRYLQNKDEDDDLISNVKDEILMMLYNKRDIITENDKLTNN